MFKAGDYVIGTDDNPYRITGKGRLCIINQLIAPKGPGIVDISVDVVDEKNGNNLGFDFWVESRFFRHLTPQESVKYRLPVHKSNKKIIII